MLSDDQFVASGEGQCDPRGISAPGRKASEMRGRNWALALAAGTLSLLVAATAAAQTTDYTYTWIDVGLPFGINNLGQIVGISESHGSTASFSILTAV